MIDHRQNKPSELAGGDSKSRADREASMRATIERMRALLDRLDTAQNAVTGPPPTRVSFSKIVEWCERSAGFPASQIYRDLLQSYLSGAFERTLVFYLTNSAPDLSKSGLDGYRMRRGFLVARTATLSPDDENEATALFDAYLAPCWLHRTAAVRWLETKGYPIPPLWEQAKHPEEPPMVVPKKKQGKRGRRPGYDWEEAQLYAEELFDLNGDFEVQMNAKEGWRSQADLERLVGNHIEKHDKKRPVDSTIRKHIVPIIEAYRNKQGADN